MNGKPLEEHIVGPRTRLRPGDVIRLRGGPRHGNHLFRKRGVYRVMAIRQWRGTVYLDVRRLEDGCLTSWHSVRITGGRRRGITPGMVDLPYLPVRVSSYNRRSR